MTPGKLFTRPRGDAPARPPVPGVHPMPQPLGETALLHVPDRLAGEHPPLLVMLHGAGGRAEHSIDMVRDHADRFGFLLLAPKSTAATWDIIARRRYGTDVAAIDALLDTLFEAHAVDRTRIGIAGFSDGASYALSLGLANGNLFSHVLAFSPGFMAPPRLEGDPAVLISHGERDEVLPIEPCSGHIVAQLRALGREPLYREFPDGHTVPDEIADWALSRFIGG